MLALPQPQALVVVDLASGTSERYDVPAFAHYVVWQTPNSVFVSDEGEASKGVVSIPGGGFKLGDRRTFDRLGRQRKRLAELEPVLPDVLDYYSAPDVRAAFPNAGGLFQTHPIVDDDVIVGSHHQGSRKIGSGDPPLGSGLAVVDRMNGDALAYLPISKASTYSAPLGWRDGLPVLMLTLPQAGQTYLVAWDDSPVPCSRSPGSTSPSVSWGTGEFP